jgi:hypothetical protein
MQYVLSFLVIIQLTMLLSTSLVLGQEKNAPQPVLNVQSPHIRTDKSVKYDYDIVYVRAPRYGDEKRAQWAEFSDPLRMEPGADLMLLHPNGTEEVLVSGTNGSVMDPFVSFDGQWVYYTKFIDAQHSGADIYKIHVTSKKISQLTNQTFTPNTGAANWAKGFRRLEQGKTALRYGVYNIGPTPVPGGKIVFTSDRNAYVPPRGYPRTTQQLFSMDDDGTNVEQIGYLNIACALHPVILKDGRILYSTLESHAQHNAILWGIWSMHPDGTNWAPVVSAFSTHGAPSGFHFQTQLSDESLIIEQYYNQNNSGFGTYFKLPPRVPVEQPAFGPGFLGDPRNKRHGGKAGYPFQMPFTPYDMELLTRFAHGDDGPAASSIPGEAVHPRKESGRSYPQALGKVTHPSGAPDNHLLTVWTPGPANHQYGYYPLIDGGIYLIKDGQPIDEPGQMLLIKNDPKYNEQWPRALVPYKRIYGVDEPQQLIHSNDGKASPYLPEGTPYGLVGTSSLYKRESAPDGKVPPGSVTAEWGKPKRHFWNWGLQGADAGMYDNSEIHAIRIVAQEPLTDVHGDRREHGPFFGSHAMERLRILGEVPVRKFDGDAQPLDPDGNPDTSFLVKIPANQPFTFQTIDKDGMVLNFSQTWHQLRPGEIRTNCGGCHAHSQLPTPFEKTVAAQPAYQLFDLTKVTPLITAKANDQSGRKWDKYDETGLRFERGIKNVEYYRDIRPILNRSCVACHSYKMTEPAGSLILDDDGQGTLKAFGHDSGPAVQVPKTYYRLAGYMQDQPRTGTGPEAATRYVQKFQARRSLFVWKIYGRRTDGWTNDTFPSLMVQGEPQSLRWNGLPVPRLDYNNPRALREYIRDNVIDNDYTGESMPPPEALTGDYKDLDGKPVKVVPLTDEDRRTIVRWIDLGCPIDLDPQYDPTKAIPKSFGWLGDDQRPTLTLTYPTPGVNRVLLRILVGMSDAYTGLDMQSFRVVADFPVDGVAAGNNLASKFQEKAQGVWELILDKPVVALQKAKLTILIKDRQGNESRIERVFSVE